MDDIEKKICDIIDSHSEEIISFGRDIWTHAELGYRETRTSKKFTEVMDRLGFHTETGIANTGVKGYLKDKQTDGPTVALIGEFDGLPIPTHPCVNPETGAAHACGHDAQITGVMGAALALSDPKIKESLFGNVVFVGVPAEECGDVAIIDELRSQGLVEYIGGKCEFLRVGAFDDIDIAVAHHVVTDAEIRKRTRTSAAFVDKKVVFHGRSAHAAGFPNLGVDALAAATLALHAVDLQRETFRDEDHVRVHSFISSGGTASNIIADTVTLEFSVRASNLDAILDASRKVDRALRAGAVATGCGLEVETYPGYLPLHELCENTEALDEAMLLAACGKYKVDMCSPIPFSAGSTDHGDLSNVLPLLFFETGGYTGQGHDKSFMLSDEYLAYVMPSKIFALTAYNLLKNNAKEAKHILQNFKPNFDRASYLAYKNEMSSHISLPMDPLPTL